ncbi:MAG TPA: hydroxyethylthiazole kinase [Clostridia bacterium]|nr:hydroxyethylthiazole kinase [Clostridia bacterium]
MTRNPKAPSQLVQEVALLLERVRTERPLVHNITNWVVTSIVANVTLAIGASPVMAHAHEEVADMARLARALALNIGTLTPYTVESMILAGKAANAAGIPVILDPVGYGATPLRVGATRRILDTVKVDILRGNLAEMAGIAGMTSDIKGVDSVGAEAPGQSVALSVAKDLKLVAVVTGPTDYISDGDRLLCVENGHPLLTRVTGTGCAATAIIGAFAAVERDYVIAAASALACYGIAAEIAADHSDGPGTFAAAFMDGLHNLRPEDVAERARLSVTRV